MAVPARFRRLRARIVMDSMIRPVAATQRRACCRRSTHAGLVCSKIRRKRCLCFWQVPTPPREVADVSRALPHMSCAQHRSLFLQGNNRSWAPRNVMCPGRCGFPAPTRQDGRGTPATSLTQNEGARNSGAVRAQISTIRLITYPSGPVKQKHRAGPARGASAARFGERDRHFRHVDARGPDGDRLALAVGGYRNRRREDAAIDGRIDPAVGDAADEIARDVAG